MSHTEGPWFISGDDAEDTAHHAHSGLAMIDTGRVSDWPIARLCEWNNVYLLAAAPDLLAACQRARRCFPSWSREATSGNISPRCTNCGTRSTRRPFRLSGRG